MKVKDSDGINEIYLKVTIQDLEEENKKLKEQNGDMFDRIMRDEEYEDSLEEHIKELEEEIKSRQEEVERFKTNAMQDMTEITELENQIKKLKSDLDECECSFGFENDEVGFWKREYKRLKKWIKDHCKGYGNLFPEDEMKRQWKKADKKRK